MTLLAEARMVFIRRVPNGSRSKTSLAPSRVAGEGMTLGGTWRVWPGVISPVATIQAKGTRIRRPTPVTVTYVHQRTRFWVSISRPPHSERNAVAAGKERLKQQG